MEVFVLHHKIRTMLIRTALLCVPSMDDEALHAVRTSLDVVLTNLVLLHERSAASDRHLLAEILRQWCDEDELDLVVTIGGTMPAPGPSPQEVTPEATLAVVERQLPGLAEEMRAYASEQSALALLDRSVAGIRGRSLILNLPAGAGAAALFLEAVVGLIEPVLAHLQEGEAAPSLADALAQMIPGSGAS
jgi:molybdopterin adenylyltransferase